ncbi:MAG: carboxypeptidase-like regulatory domain-containing protein [Chitinophagia bacterium]|nr:carboxypeptidase-like regulatory domain-containing protein [Chitinophagia bacterium]
MNTAYRIVLILLCIAGAGNWAGAVVIKGKVTDKAGNILPYSTIFVEGTTIGTNANAVGYYELDLPEGLYKINCRLVGYKEAHQNVDCRAGNAPLLPFVLESEYIERKDATVYANGEDPAYNIIRKAIAQRPGHLDQTNSFTASVYMKGVFRTRAMPGKVMGKKVDKGDLTEMGLDTAGKGVLFLVEEDADYYKRNKDEKYVIRSVRQSGIPGSVGFSSFPPVINYYKNSMDVLSQSPRGFISPIADNALFYYRYKYLGQFMEQGHIVNKIEVKPRRGNENCFTGTIYIAESDYYIHSLELTLTKNSGIDQFDTLTIKQVYLPNNTDQYAIKSQCKGRHTRTISKSYLRETVTG